MGQVMVLLSIDGASKKLVHLIPIWLMSGKVVQTDLSKPKPGMAPEQVASERRC